VTVARYHAVTIIAVNMIIGRVAPAATALIFVLTLGLALGSVVFWIVRLVEICRIPADTYRAGGSEKVIWIVVVVLGGVLGALAWHFSRRHRVLTSTG
jgi:hypothetical protein